MPLRGPRDVIHKRHVEREEYKHHISMVSGPFDRVSWSPYNLLAMHKPFPKNMCYRVDLNQRSRKQSEHGLIAFKAKPFSSELFAYILIWFLGISFDFWLSKSTPPSISTATVFDMFLVCCLPFKPYSVKRKAYDSWVV